MNGNSATNLPSALTPAAAAERERFLARYQEQLEGAKQVSLTVLVWGPGPTSRTAVARKRVQIREALLREGFNAIFSEDVPVPPGAEPLSEKARELAQAGAAHLIIVLLEGSPGALAEVHDFCDFPDVARKMFVMAPDRYKQSYSGSGALIELSDGYGGVHWYADGDVEACNVLSCAMRRAQALRQIAYRARRE